ncbi:MAG: BlaI/MecI/CopY family transcriptional regulator [Clostridiales bacterium]|jgi:BlaI family penicillinase repressor|nr:BlaI/MecI/CopY family transcriptional regulator [Clostridiales bacterium]
MNKSSILTDSEWQIMQLLWNDSPLTITKMEKLLKDKTSWSKHVIISFLKRMLTKETITVKDDGRVKRFYPILTKKDIYLTETKTFLTKLYEGKLGLMISSLVDNDELKEDEIDELISILNKSKETGKQDA